MILLAAVDSNWAIGKGGRQLVSIPADQALFRQETMGKTIVMGRKTFDAIHGGVPLPGRTSYVLSEDESFQPRSTETGIVRVFRKMEDLKNAIAELPADEVFLIGGGTMYDQLLPLCDLADITWMEYEYDADTYCPNLERDPAWEMTMESDEQIYFDLIYYFRRYERTEQSGK